ncbi:MAG: MATE family efflux transporter [Pirellulales bacterium]
MLGSMTPTPSWAMLQELWIANFAVWGEGGGNQSKNGGLVSQAESSAESTGKTSALRQWWTAPAGPRDVLAIAMPLIISTAFWSIQWFVDRLYLMWYSPIDAMAAAMPMAQWGVVHAPMGIASYANTFVAQYYGAGRKDRIGASVGQGVWVGIISTPLILFLSFALRLMCLHGQAIATK